VHYICTRVVTTSGRRDSCPNPVYSAMFVVLLRHLVSSSACHSRVITSRASSKNRIFIFHLHAFRGRSSRNRETNTGKWSDLVLSPLIVYCNNLRLAKVGVLWKTYILSRRASQRAPFGCWLSQDNFKLPSVRKLSST
jgi:hypothetical protein